VQIGVAASSSLSSHSNNNLNRTDEIVLSDGRRVSVSPPCSSKSGAKSTPVVPPPFDLTRWTLTAEHWEVPADLYDVSVVARKHNTTHQLAAPLRSWTDPEGLGPQLANASGVGYYTARFEWPPKVEDKNKEGNSNSSSCCCCTAVDGAYLSFGGEVLHTLRVRVNGRALDPVDLRAPRVDIGPFLRLEGENEVVVVVPTTMWNYVRSIFAEIRNAGDPPLKLNVGTAIPVPGPSRNGLLGTVSVVSYREVRV
jgi:hypothetical protein